MDSSFSFNTEILKIFDLENAPAEEREKFFQMAGQAILTQVVRRIEQQLPQDKREEFLGLFERPSSDEEKTAFFKQHVPNFKELLLEEVTRFKREALEFNKSPHLSPGH